MKLRKLLVSGMLMSAMAIFAQTHTQGIEYYKADQFNNALELLNRNLNNPGTDQALSYYYLGQIALRNNNNAEAKNYFDKGLAANAENPYNYVGLGFLALKSGDLKGAEKYFKEAEGKAKKDQSLQIEIARAYYNVDPVGYKEKYEKIVANALKKDAKNPDIYIFEGDVLRSNAYQTGDSKTYGAAAAKYDMATSYDPTSAVAYVKYADMYKYANNPNFAIIKLEELLRNNPNSALGQRELANAYYDTQQYDKAASEYGDYVKNPNHFKSDEDQYALILFGNNEFQKGYDYSSSLLKENPNNFTAQRFQFMNAAQIASMQDQLLPMADALYNAHKRNSANKFAPIDYTLIADELNKGKRNEEAIAVLQEAISDFPQNGNFNKQLAGIYIDLEDYGAAANAYNDFIKKLASPGYNEFAQQALYAYFAGLKNNDADFFNMSKEYAGKAAEAYPTHYKSYKILGDVAIATSTKENAPKAAFEDYTKAAELLGDTPDPRYNNDAKTIYNYLGYYYLENKDNAKAKEFFQKSLAIDPNADLQKLVNSL